jgi:hypothetical protein
MRFRAGDGNRPLQPRLAADEIHGACLTRAMAEVKGQAAAFDEAVSINKGVGQKERSRTRWWQAIHPRGDAWRPAGTIERGVCWEGVRLSGRSGPWLLWCPQ